MSNKTNYFLLRQFVSIMYFMHDNIYNSAWTEMPGNMVRTCEQITELFQSQFRFADIFTMETH